MKFLFTDLDGTFLGGTRLDQERLIKTLQSAGIGLVYVSGRGHERIFPAIDSKELMRPSAAIGDVGTSLWNGNGETFSRDYEALMQSHWKDGHRLLRDELKTFLGEGLNEQPIFGPYRYSLYYTDTTIAERASQCIERLGFDSLLSDNRYLDALPKGVNKGFAVQWLMNHWGLTAKQVLVAGDTLNDLAMLRLPIPAVVVANAEPALKQALQNYCENPKLMLVREAGAAGIHAALEQLGWI